MEVHRRNYYFIGLRLPMPSTPLMYSRQRHHGAASEEKSGASSTLSQFGGLAAMAEFPYQAIPMLNRWLLLYSPGNFFVSTDGKKLLPILFEEIWDAESQSWIVQTQEDEPTEQMAIETFKSILSVDEDKKSGLISMTISWKDPAVAAEWANDLVKQLNEQLREKAVTDSQKRVGYLEQELAKTTLRTVPYFTTCLSQKTESDACQCKRGFCPQSNRPRCCSGNSF